MANKADRLREFLRDRKETPLVPVPTRQQWDALVEAAELTPDDLKLLARQIAGHQERARKAQASGDEETFGFEATQALALDPFHDAFLAEVAEGLKKTGASNPELDTLRRRVSQKKKRGPMPSWWLAATLVTVGLGVLTTVLLIWHPWQADPGLAPPRPQAETRTLPVEWSTGSIKAEVALRKSVLEVYAEARVLDLEAVVVFPEVEVGLWAARVTVLDATGQPVFSADRELHGADEGRLEPGQGLAISLQWDAAPWKGEAASISVTTLQLDSVAASAQTRFLLPVAGSDALTKGYAFSVAQVSNVWKSRFATKANQLNLELTNTGLRPFRTLKFSVDWRDASGKTLKSSTWNPISEFRTELVSGGHLSTVIETVFETELFPWKDGDEPRPVIRLVTWK